MKNLVLLTLYLITIVSCGVQVSDKRGMKGSSREGTKPVGDELVDSAFQLFQDKLLAPRSAQISADTELLRLLSESQLSRTALTDKGYCFVYLGNGDGLRESQNKEVVKLDTGNFAYWSRTDAGAEACFPTMRAAFTSDFDKNFLDLHVSYFGL